MFKARWRSEKNKIKAVFKLQFRAAQIPQSGWETVVVALVPLDVGKPTARSERATPAVEGSGCTWEKAVFETVRLSRESKTGKIGENVYRFLILANDLPKARVLAEASFDFAEYAETVKPSTVALPLKASNCSPVLHVTVQRMQDDIDGRETEDNMVNRHRRTLHSQLSDGDKAESDDASNGIDSAQGSPLVKGQAPLKFHSTRAMVLHVESNGNIAKSRSFDTISAIVSEIGSERNTPIDARSRNSKFNKEPSSFLSPLSNGDALQKLASNSSDLVTTNGDHWGSNTEWSASSAPDESLDGSTNSSEDTGLRDKLQGTDSLEKLRNDVVSLARQVEVSELELQALRKQVVKERRLGEDLSKEVSILKKERDALKRKCELLKASHNDNGKEKVNSLQFDGEDLRPFFEEMKQELNHEKNLNANLHLQLQKTQESNAELILAVKDLEELLKQKNRETSCPNCKQPSVIMELNEDTLLHKQVNEFSCSQESQKKQDLSATFSEHEEDDELEVLAKERDDVEVACSLEQKITDLNAEIELYKKDRDDIEMQMEQLALDYVILKQENHDISTKLEQSQIREQLRMQYECSAHTSIISDLEAHVENLEKELEKQAETFEADLACIMDAKVEQEQRAIQAEEMLSKIKWNNVTTAERLQEEFRKLSMQMSTTFDANEKLAMKALTEASELRLQTSHLQELLEKANEELASTKYQYKIQLKELLRQIDLKTEDADQLLVKLKNMYEEIENQKKTHEATQKALSQEISVLKSTVEMLMSENSELSTQIGKEQKLMSEMEDMKKLIRETEMLLQDRTTERDALDTKLCSMVGQVNNSENEINNLRHTVAEKDLKIRTMVSDLEILRTQYSELDKSLLKDDLAMLDNSRKQVLHSSNLNSRSGPTVYESQEYAILHERIRLLEDEIKSRDSAVQENGVGRVDMNDLQSGNKLEEDIIDASWNTKIISNGKGRNDTMLLSQSESMENTCFSDRSGSDKDPNARNTNSISYLVKSDELLNEVATLKEKNQTMENELKEMQERYSEISLKFAEVEGERQQLVMKIRTLKNASRT